MSMALDTLSAAFPNYDVITDTRPGGGLRLTLKSGEETVLQRAIPATQCTSKMHLEWVISAIRRDLALEAGVPPSIVNLQSQSRVRLPTYS
jgi:hypothetical protein